MKIAYIASGAAGMYCGMCLHDNTLAAALIRAGQEVLLIPTYTPLKTDETNVSQERVFFGGINVFLQQKSCVFRHTPWGLDRLLDTKPFMKLLSKQRGTVDPTKLGDLTVSMLLGENGKQRKELDKLLAWLEADVRPDVVHLSNAMLIAMAPVLRQRLDCPVVCSLSGEDVFLERIVEPHYSRARTLLRQHARDAQGYVAMNRYYADFMIDYMDLPPERVQVIPHGLHLAGHAEQPRQRSADGDPVVIGYFARVCQDKGFHLLVDAFMALCQDPDMPPLILRAAGYCSKGDRLFLAEQAKKLQAAGLVDRFEYLGEPDREGKIAIIQSFDVMSVPGVYPESKGLSVLEALANGVPVVQPAHGTFPELIEDTDAGLLFEPMQTESLAVALKKLVLDADLANHCGRKGHAAIRERYNDEEMARQTLQLYARVLDEQRGTPAREYTPA